ncbi:hypothetical protein [Pseudomonas abietaniphila]|nr:hypothetical protein [Pseudomonas abietaniphila]
MREKDLAGENARLVAENEALIAEVKILQGKLALLTAHNSLAQGMRGEWLVSESINGTITTHNAGHDILTAGGLLKLEIKYSALNVAVRRLGSGGSPTLRWAWSKPMGESSKKTYDRLILVGDKDPRFLDQYQDKASPYVFFDVPFDEIVPLTVQTNGGKYRSIQLTTNPRTAKSSASSLFTKYQVSIDELNARYGL